MDTKQLETYIDDAVHVRRVYKQDIVGELSEHLNVDPRTILRWLRIRSIPGKYEEELVEYIKLHKPKDAVPACAQTLLEHIPLPCAMVDLNYRFIAVSSSYVEAFRLQDEVPLEGRSLFEILPEDRHEKARSRYDAVYDGKSVYIDDDVPYEILTRMGEDIAFSFEIHPWMDSCGKIGGALYVGRPVEAGSGNYSLWGDQITRTRAEVSTGSLQYFTDSIKPFIKSQILNMKDYIKVGVVKQLFAITIPMLLGGKTYRSHIVISVEEEEDETEKSDGPPREKIAGRF